MILYMLVLLTQKLANYAGFLFEEGGSLLKVWRVDSSDPMISFLQERKFSCSALLCSIGVEEESNASLLGTFLNSEIRRLQDFIRVCVVMRTLPFENDASSLRQALTMIPLFRSVLEGYFKADYIFCILEMGKPLKLNELNARFERIVDNCRFEYNKFANNRSSSLGLEISPLNSVGKKIGIETLIEHAHRDSSFDREKSQDEVIYSTYCACCFYTHGHMNSGLLMAAGIPEFSYPNLNFMMEVVSIAYLKYFATLVTLKGDSLKNLVEEIEIAQDSSQYI